MSRFKSWRIWLGILLVMASVAFYSLHYLLFRDAHHIFIYMVGDIAFVPIEVLIVTMIIHHLLEKREKASLMKKMNMLIGAFFSDVGTKLLKSFTDLDPRVEVLQDSLRVDTNWSEESFDRINRFLKEYEYGIDINKSDLPAIRDFLREKMQFLLNLIANPTLLEHDSFTELLWAVFHLAEELDYREDLKNLPETDYKHIAGDIRRAYVNVTQQWVDYMRHLKKEYPYLFSLAMRTSPFDPDSSVVIY